MNANAICFAFGVFIFFFLMVINEVALNKTWRNGCAINARILVRYVQFWMGRGNGFDYDSFEFYCCVLDCMNVIHFLYNILSLDASKILIILVSAK